MKLLAWMVISLLLAMPPLALADKGERDKKDDQKKEQKHEKPTVPKVIKDTPLAAVPVGAAVIWAVPAAAFAVVPMVAMFIYDVFYAKYPPGFAGQEWNSCANAVRYSATEKKCMDAGFLH